MTKTKLLKKDGEILTYSAIKAISEPEPNIIKTKDLYGEYHIQTIGNPSKRYKVEATAYEYQKNKIDIAYATGERLLLQIDGNEETGFIDERPQWELLTKRYRDVSKRMYTAEIIFLKESAELTGIEY